MKLKILLMVWVFKWFLVLQSRNVTFKHITLLLTCLLKKKNVIRIYNHFKCLVNTKHRKVYRLSTDSSKPLFLNHLPWSASAKLTNMLSIHRLHAWSLQCSWECPSQCYKSCFLYKMAYLSHSHSNRKCRQKFTVIWLQTWIFNLI